MASVQVPRRLGLASGEWVQVRSREEVLSTLDANGQLDRMPFMPEMFKYCGQKVQVGKRAHKTCDPVNGLESRSLPDAVHLEGLRCDGAAHGGCQAGCLLFWKEAWLKRVDDASASIVADSLVGACSEVDVQRGTTTPAPGDDGAIVYVCQATQVAAATTPLPWWDARQYWEDYQSGNVGLFRVISAATFWTYHNISQLGIGLGSAMRWAYDQWMRVVGGGPYPWRVGRVQKGERTPTATLGIQEGELVQIRSYQEILDTLDDEWRNRGLYFDAEMVPYTGGTFKVLTRVKRIIDEKTGRMLDFKNPALILDGVVCQARYAKCRKLCPRAYYLYWREIWVNRVNDRNEAPASSGAQVSSGPA